MDVKGLLKNAQIETVSSLPELKPLGRIVMLSTNNEVYISDGTNWIKTGIGSPQVISEFNINWLTGLIHTKTISSNSEFTFSNDISGDTIEVYITSTGSYNVTWPAGIKWANGVVATQTPSGTDVYVFRKVGSNIYGSQANNLS